MIQFVTPLGGPAKLAVFEPSHISRGMILLSESLKTIGRAPLLSPMIITSRLTCCTDGAVLILTKPNTVHFVFAGLQMPDEDAKYPVAASVNATALRVQPVTAWLKEMP